MERSLNNNEIMLLVVLYQRKFHPGWNHSHLFGNRKRLPRSHVGVGLPQIQYLQGCKTPANNIHYQISCCYLTFISLAFCPIMKQTRMLQIVLPGTAFVTDHIKNFIKYWIASTKIDTTWARLFKIINPMQ